MTGEKATLRRVIASAIDRSDDESDDESHDVYLLDADAVLTALDEAGYRIIPKDTLILDEVREVPCAPLVWGDESDSRGGPQ